MIEAVLEQPRYWRAFGVQIALDVPAHLAPTVVHAVVGIGAFDRVAQLRDQFGPGQKMAETLRCLRMRQIAR